MTGGRGRNCKQLLDDPKKTRGYLKLKEETQNRPLWRTRYEAVARRTTEYEKKSVVLGTFHREM